MKTDLTILWKFLTFTHYDFMNVTKCAYCNYEFFFFIRMDAVKSSIKCIIENISDDTLEKIIKVLDELGVDNISHLNLVKEEDLTPVLKKIQARLLVREWSKNSK